MMERGAVRHNRSRRPCFNIHGRFNSGQLWEACLALRAVVFDYGMVLTGPPDAEARAALLRVTGLTEDRFDAIYWADRLAYDEGKLTGIAFWTKFVNESGLNPAPDRLGAVVEELNGLDAQMWTTQNLEMLAWQAELNRRGLRTAILSNMGDSVLAKMKRKFDWLTRFDVLVWSYQLRMAKPDPAIYLHVLKELGTRPEETLFLDDKLENIEAAQALGLHAIQFSSVEKLRGDLVADGFDAELPLP